MRDAFYVIMAIHAFESVLGFVMAVYLDLTVMVNVVTLGEALAKRKSHSRS